MNNVVFLFSSVGIIIRPNLFELLVWNQKKSVQLGTFNVVGHQPKGNSNLSSTRCVELLFNFTCRLQQHPKKIKKNMSNSKQICELIERPRTQFMIVCRNIESNYGCALVVLPGTWNCPMRLRAVGELTWGET